MNSGPVVKYEQHPRGNNGARKSVRKTVQAAAAGRMSLKLGSLAQSILKDAGVLRGSAYDQAKALHGWVQVNRASLPDPVDAERIVLPDCLLADCDGLSFDAGDCDDKGAALAAMVESVGITAAIIGQAFDFHQFFSHILIGCEVEPGVWYYADAFDEGLKFGEARPPTREIWALVPSGAVLCDHSPSCITKMQGVHPNVHDRETGDAIWVGTGMTGEAPDLREQDNSEKPSALWTATKTILTVGVLGFAGYGGFKLATEDWRDHGRSNRTTL